MCIVQLVQLAYLVLIILLSLSTSSTVSGSEATSGQHGDLSVVLAGDGAQIGQTENEKTGSGSSLTGFESGTSVSSHSQSSVGLTAGTGTSVVPETPATVTSGTSVGTSGESSVDSVSGSQTSLGVATQTFNSERPIDSPSDSIDSHSRFSSASSTDSKSDVTVSSSTVQGSAAESHGASGSISGSLSVASDSDDRLTSFGGGSVTSLTSSDKQAVAQTDSSASQQSSDSFSSQRPSGLPGLQTLSGSPNPQGPSGSFLTHQFSSLGSRDPYGFFGSQVPFGFYGLQFPYGSVEALRTRDPQGIYHMLYPIDFYHVHLPYYTHSRAPHASLRPANSPGFQPSSNTSPSLHPSPFNSPAGSPVGSKSSGSPNAAGSVDSLPVHTENEGLEARQESLPGSVQSTSTSSSSLFLKVGSGQDENPSVVLARGGAQGQVLLAHLGTVQAVLLVHSVVFLVHLTLLFPKVLLAHLGMVQAVLLVHSVVFLVHLTLLFPKLARPITLHSTGSPNSLQSTGSQLSSSSSHGSEQTGVLLGSQHLTPSPAAGSAEIQGSHILRPAGSSEVPSTFLSVPGFEVTTGQNEGLSVVLARGGAQQGAVSWSASVAKFCSNAGSTSGSRVASLDRAGQESQGSGFVSGSAAQGAGVNSVSVPLSLVHLHQDPACYSVCSNLLMKVALALPLSISGNRLHFPLKQARGLPLQTGVLLLFSGDKEVRESLVILDIMVLHLPLTASISNRPTEAAAALTVTAVDLSSFTEAQ
ncbi:hypothetical protein O3P69_000428 [Scylla paramamosain]|uniref:Uncharacterized protein n=1 Tax=Scylla paramamosain TaxID=85552 RepID=A0AAW0UUT9_SCYPA